MAFTNANEIAFASDAAALAPAAAALDAYASSDTPSAARRATPFIWLGRPRRILLALSACWVLNIFDLCFTMRESQEAHFIELNPIAASLLGGPTHWIIAYKLLLVVGGSSILLFLRRHTVTELASWFLMAVSVYVGTRWYVYFECLTDDRYNSFITAAMGP